MNPRILILGIFLFFISGLASWNLFSTNNRRYFLPPDSPSLAPPTPLPTPTVALVIPPSEKILQGGTHVFQTFNNCGPASLSMILSYYGLSVSQQELGLALRPHQNPQGINDDKSVTLSELAEKSKEYGFIPYHRPGGTEKLIKLFLAHDMPVITRTTTKPTQDIGHFRVIKGYDEPTGEFIQDDSLQGKNLRYTYENFNNLWQTFGYEFLALVPHDKKDIAEAILGPLTDEKAAWLAAAESARTIHTQKPDDFRAAFNLSVALYHAGDYLGSAKEFESVEHRLPFRTLWYQIEPILAYYELEDYDRVFAITEKILTNENRAFSELYLIRGDIYKKQGNIEAARTEYEKAIRYNQNLKAARDALSGI